MPIAGSGHEKDWKDGANPVEGPPATPITAAALEDIETRLADYADEVAVLKSQFTAKGQVPVATGNGTAGTIAAPAADQRLVGDPTSSTGWRIRVKDEVLNVKDPAIGAVGNGTTNDKAAIQAAITVVTSNAEGGTVYFPPGDYAVNTTGGGLSLPNDVPFKLKGAGHTLHPVGSLRASARIKASGGTSYLFQNPNSGSSIVRCRVSMENLELYGGSTNPIIYLQRTNSSLFRDMFFTGGDTANNYNHSTTRWDGCWNTTFEHCFWNHCGNGDTYAGMSFGMDGDASGSTITVKINLCEWEVSWGTDIRLTGDSTRPCSGVNFTNCKSESISANPTRTYPIIALDQAKQNVISNFWMAAGHPAPVVRSGAGAVKNVLTGCVFYNSGGGTGNRPLIDQTGGKLLVGNSSFHNSAANVNTCWAIGSGVGQMGALSGGNMYEDPSQTSAASGKRHTDARTGTTGQGLVPVRASNNYGNNSYPCGPEFVF